MFIYEDDFILTPEKAEKIKHKIEVLGIKQAVLTTVCCLFEKYNGKVLNKRVFDGVKESFQWPGLNVGISIDSCGCLEISAYGTTLGWYEGRCLFYCSQIKAGDRLDYEKFKTESWKLIDRYGQRGGDCEKALKTLKSQLKKALKAYQTLKAVADSLPYEIKDEFKLLKELL